MIRITQTLILLLSLSVTLFSGCTKDSGSTDSNSLAAGGGGTGTAGSLSRFVIVGNYLYSVDMQQLNIFNISDPANTSKVATQPIGFDIETIFPYGDKLFIGSSSAMYIYSLANPAAPQRLSAVSHFRACDPVVANDTIAYVTLRSGTRCFGTVNALLVYKINNIANPIQVAQVNMDGPYGLGYSGNGLYVCDGQNLRVFDIANGASPMAKPSINTTEKFYDVIPYGNLLICYIDNGVSLYDITNRLAPVFLSKLTN